MRTRLIRTFVVVLVAGLAGCFRSAPLASSTLESRDAGRAVDAGDDAHADGDILNGHIDASVLDAGVDTGVHDAGERDGAGAFDPTGLDCYPVIVREEMGPTEPWLLGSEHFCKVISFYASESDRTGAPLPDTGYCYVYDGQYSCGIWGAIGVVDRQSYEEFCAYEAAFGARQYFCERYE